METNKLFDEIDYCLRIKDSEKIEQLNNELQEYSKTCLGSEKDLCAIYQTNISKFFDIKHVFDQQEKLQQFVRKWRNPLFKVEYITPYGEEMGVDIYVNRFVMEMTYKYVNDADKNEIRSKFYISNTPLFRQFVLKKDLSSNHFENLQKLRNDYYVQRVTYSNWADTIIGIINTIAGNKDDFVKICEESCPYHNDGKHKYKSWKTLAKVEVSFVDNTGLVQGVKKGETIIGGHVVGGNGSFRYWDKRTYILKCTIDKLACEKPLRHTIVIDADEYLRALKDRLGRTNMPYELLNSKLSKKIEVITTDMNKEPEDRDFYPVEYNHDWIKLLDESFVDL